MNIRVRTIVLSSVIASLVVQGGFIEGHPKGGSGRGGGSRGGRYSGLGGSGIGSSSDGGSSLSSGTLIGIYVGTFAGGLFLVSLVFILKRFCCNDCDGEHFDKPDPTAVPTLLSPVTRPRNVNVTSSVASVTSFENPHFLESSNEADHKQQNHIRDSDILKLPPPSYEEILSKDKILKIEHI